MLATEFVSLRRNFCCDSSASRLWSGDSPFGLRTEDTVRACGEKVCYAGGLQSHPRHLVRTDLPRSMELPL